MGKEGQEHHSPEPHPAPTPTVWLGADHTAGRGPNPGNLPRHPSGGQPEAMEGPLQKVPSLWLSQERG